MIVKRCLGILCSSVVVNLHRRAKCLRYFVFAVALQFLPLALKAAPSLPPKVGAEVTNRDTNIGEEVWQSLDCTITPVGANAGHAGGGGIDGISEDHGGIANGLTTEQEDCRTTRNNGGKQRRGSSDEDHAWVSFFAFVGLLPSFWLVFWAAGQTSTWRTRRPNVRGKRHGTD